MSWTSSKTQRQSLVTSDERVEPGPEEAALGVSAIQRAREEHVLGADKHCVALRVKVPGVRRATAHQQMDPDAVAALEVRALVVEVQRAEPGGDGAEHLGGEGPHRKTQHQPARRRPPDTRRREAAAVEPAQHDRGSLAGSGGRRQRLRQVRGEGQDALVRERGAVRGAEKYIVVGHDVPPRSNPAQPAKIVS
jgi:hypothetical protein